MNDSDLRIMEDTVAILFAARRGEKPTEEQIKTFDDLYRRMKVKPNLLIHYPSKIKHGWLTVRRGKRTWFKKQRLILKQQ